MDEEMVRELVRQELVRFVEILKDEVASTPMRADGNINARDFYETLRITEKKVK